MRVVEGGAAHGKPIFALNGTPSSRLLYERHVLDATERGIRLISYDRPGYGESTSAPGRKVVDAVDDVVAIADSLKIDRFAVWGISGGGPHALACATRLRGRVVAAASLASVTPYPAAGLDYFAGMGEENLAEFNAALEGPAELERFLGPVRDQMLASRPEDLFKAFETLLSPVDKAVLTGDLAEYYWQNEQEALRYGSAGWRDDDLAFISPWGFDPAEVAIPLLLWHGRHDRFVPVAHGRWLAGRIPRAEARISDDDGHLTLFERRIPETHEWLLKHF